MTNKTLQIGTRRYTVTSTTTRTNNWGQLQTWTDLKGARGADVTLIETHCKNRTVANLIHFGRSNPSETIDPTLIKR